MSEKFIHEWKNASFSTARTGALACKHCGVYETNVTNELVSRRCTRKLGEYWCGCKALGNEAIWVNGEIDSGIHWPYEAVNRHDDHYDIDPAAEARMREIQEGYIAIAGDLVVDEKPEHVMGLSPEEIDWEAYRSFMRELQT